MDGKIYRSKRTYSIQEFQDPMMGAMVRVTGDDGMIHAIITPAVFNLMFEEIVPPTT